MYRKNIIIILGIFVLTMPLAARAQGTDRAFSVQNFLWAPGDGNYLTVEGASLPDDFRLRIGGLLHYQHRPLHLRGCERVEDDRCLKWNDHRTPLIKHHLSSEIIGSFSFNRIFEVGVAFPVVWYQTGDDLESAGGIQSVQAPSKTTGIGDLRLHLKLDLLHGLFGYKGDKFGLALVPVFTFPTGNALVPDSFMGHSSISVHPKMAFDVSLGRVRLGFNAGYLWREEEQFYLAEIGPRVTYGVATEIAFTDQWSGIVEAFGSSGFTLDLTSAPLEADIAVRYRATPNLTVLAGMGTGIIAGVGSPLPRAFAGVVWSPVIGSDRDKDGILDSDDECPDDPEDRDGFEDIDGCPDPDNDQDGILDNHDDCPDDAEDFDGYQDRDGCPESDNDMDGIPDEADLCPKEKEVLNGVDDEDGCPDEGEELVEISEDQIVLLKNVQFEYDSKAIDEDSHPTMDVVVTVLKSNPKMKIRIEGHTDHKGSRRYNWTLSRRRAKTVKAYIVDQGINPGRLDAKGFGQDRPLKSNETREGRAANRRVEFHIVSRPKRRRNSGNSNKL